MNSPRLWRVGTLTYTSGSLIVLFSWLLFGDFALSMRDRAVGPMASWYLNSIGVPNLLFAILLTSFPAFVGLILTPIISVKSDRHRGRWGRRIPFLLITSPISAGGILGLAVTPIVAKWVHGHFPEQDEMHVALLCFGVFWTLYELGTVAGGAVLGGLVNDVVPKEVMGRFFGLFRAVSLIDGIIFNYWIMGKTPDHFTLILTIIGVFYGSAFMWMCIRVKEGTYPPPPPKKDIHLSFTQKASQEIGGYVRDCYRNPYYLSIYLFFVFAFMATNPINTFALPYASSLEISMDLYGKGLAITYLISLCLSFFIGWAVDVFHPLRVVIATQVLYVIAMLAGAIFVHGQTAFLVAWIGHGVLSGCFFTSVAALGPRIFPREKFAQYSSAFGILNSFAIMAIAPLIGIVIDATGKNFRYTFISGAFIAGIAVILGLIVHRQFMRLGGPKNYVAP